MKKILSLYNSYSPSLFLIVVLVFFSSSFCLAQQSLEKKISELSNQKRYKEVQEMLLTIARDKNRSDGEKLEAYLLLSDTRKRLFDYGKARYYLSKAMDYAKTIADKNVVGSRKAMISFDVHEYETADSIMDFIQQKKYEGIPINITSILVMQKGYIHYLNKQYDAANERYLSALKMMKESRSCHEPILYGKMMVLEAERNNSIIVDDLYAKGMERAKACDIQKYELYISEEYSRSLFLMGLVEKATEVNKNIDSLRALYKSTKHLEELNRNLDGFETNSKNKSWVWLIVGIFFFVTLGVVFSVSKRQKIKKGVNINQEKPDQSKPEELETPIINKTFDIQNHRASFRKRQWEILQFMMKEKNNSYIANKLHISVSAVKYHITMINKILGEKNMIYDRQANTFFESLGSKKSKL